MGYLSKNSCFQIFYPFGNGFRVPFQHLILVSIALIHKSRSDPAFLYFDMLAWPVPLSLQQKGLAQGFFETEKELVLQLVFS